MNLNAESAQRWRNQAIAFALIALLALPFLYVLDRFSYDFPFSLRTGTPPPDALIILMDDACRGQLHQPVQGAWDRNLHRRVVENLLVAGAREVVFDVLFDEPWPQKEVDQQFAAAIKTNVVLAASFEFSGHGAGLIQGRLLPPAEPLDTAAAWGIVELPKDEDGVLRRHFYHPDHTNLAWQAAAVIGEAPVDRGRPRWINYYGPPGTFAKRSLCDALSGLSPDVVSNKIIFIGKAPAITYQGSHGNDEFPTAYTRWTDTESTGVEIQATATLNLLHRDWLVRLPWLAEFLLLLAVAALAGFLLPLMRRRTALAVTVLLAVAACASGVFLALHFHVWFCWAAISFVQAPAALAWIMVNQKVLRSAAQVGTSGTAVFADFLKGVPAPPAPEKTGTIALEFPPPEKPAIPDHEMIRQFGGGAFGKVWLARSSVVAYRAVKIVSRNDFSNSAPYDHEFRGILAFEPISRSHEGFVDILHVGRRDEQGFFYYVMELADDENTGRDIVPEKYSAKTLSSEIKRRGRLPFHECVQIGRSLADALHALHQARLVHRDIKPANIIFVGGVPKLADIGAVARTTEAHTMIGTPGFMPPEGPGSPQADLYSLGKVLYEMAMGRDRHKFPEQPPSLADDPERVQLTALYRIAQQACETDLTRRYQTALQIRTDLDDLLSRFPPTAATVALKVPSPGNTPAAPPPVAD